MIRPIGSLLLKCINNNKSFIYQTYYMIKFYFKQILKMYNIKYVEFKNHKIMILKYVSNYIFVMTFCVYVNV